MSANRPNYVIILLLMPQKIYTRQILLNMISFSTFFFGRPIIFNDNEITVSFMAVPVYGTLCQDYAYFE